MSYIIGTASCKKYSSVNYDQLLASIENEKVKGHHRLARVKQLTSQVKESKNSSLLNRHRSSWIKMHNYLKKQVRGVYCYKLCIQLNFQIMKQVEITKKLSTNRVED
jgi:hypothetical protein